MNIMKKAFVLVLILCMLEGMTVTMNHQKTLAMKKTEPLSTWLWDTSVLAADAAELLTFMEQNQVTDVFVQINKTIPARVYKNFIKKASSKGINVHALDGAPNWVSNQGLMLERSFFSWVNQYQLKALPEEQFSGIHLDVEPYLYSGWTSQYAKTVFAYQSLLIDSKQSAQALGLPLTVDIPFWFDEKSYSNKYGKGKLSDWVIANTDSITIMAYRDGALGPNGIIEAVKNEMNDAALQNKKVSIGIETVKSSEGNYVSFYEEGQSYLAEQLGMIEARYQNLSSFNGFSVHSIHSWMNMKP